MKNLVQNYKNKAKLATLVNISSMGSDFTIILLRANRHFLLLKKCILLLLLFISQHE